MYNVSLNDILAGGTVESISVNLRSSIGAIGQMVMGIGANVNGEWTQVDVNETINSMTYTIAIDNADFCSNLDGEFLQIGYWYGTTTPLYLESITVAYKEAEETTTEAVTTVDETTTTVATETTTTETEPENVNVIGDYNNDGTVDYDDAVALKKYIVGIYVEGFEINDQSADVNGDGIVNVFDYMTLTTKIA